MGRCGVGELLIVGSETSFLSPVRRVSSQLKCVSIVPWFWRPDPITHVSWMVLATPIAGVVSTAGSSASVNTVEVLTSLSWLTYLSPSLRSGPDSGLRARRGLGRSTVGAPTIMDNLGWARRSPTKYGHPQQLFGEPRRRMMSLQTTLGLVGGEEGQRGRKTSARTHNNGKPLVKPSISSPISHDLPR